MRGWDVRSEVLFSYASCEARVPKDHPLRPIRQIVDEALAALSSEFETLYARFGRPSIPPERLLRALLLQAFYSVRSEKQLMEQLNYNLLFRWFVGLSLDAAVCGDDYDGRLTTIRMAGQVGRLGCFNQGSPRDRGGTLIVGQAHHRPPSQAVHGIAQRGLQPSGCSGSFGV